ncbi:hypothetical protein [Dokdonella koreensis]|uniref:Methylaspartate ammonia-lyase n=1 Tax=Dokdonella koreensis DS-123 TaxID=1300342 RepID=A0A167GBG2_9GAMM|nr:hypothetical protein [Dokdonella koreensis]ANB16369.1 Hypothetical protein I596_332 [Dokdonella koreensis DS-123]
MRPERRCRGVRIVLATLLVLLPVLASAAPRSAALLAGGRAACRAIAAQVDAVPGDGPLLLRSYDPVAPGEPSADEPALVTVAFGYDNALSVLALTACERPRQARRIALALRAAAMGEARLRNAYRAGPVEGEGVPLPNGWWDAAQGRWVEDAHQMGTATGNVAWTALAMLAMAARDDDPLWRAAAVRLAEWALAHTGDARGDGGFTGGVHGFDAAPQRLTWKSTEHNVDLAAVFGLLARGADAERWRTHADQARRFVAAQWDAAQGRFRVGTQADGITPNESTSGLDAQLWPLLLADAPAEWWRALAFAERMHGVRGGFDFNADRDGIWSEGTAQAILVYRRAGRSREARIAYAELPPVRSASGYLDATDRPSITTGLAIGPDSTTDDFRYYRRPHLGATAWLVLAARRFNPFTLREG